MNDLVIFDHPDFGKVRVVQQNSEPWFVASDVARMLGYKVPKDAIRQHCKSPGTAVIHRGTSGGNPNVTIIPERDVYRLISRSKLPAAERFEEWVFGVVLPQIRKTGMYSAVPELTGYYAEKTRAVAAIFREQQHLLASKIDSPWEAEFWYGFFAYAENMAHKSDSGVCSLGARMGIAQTRNDNPYEPNKIDAFEMPSMKVYFKTMPPKVQREYVWEVAPQVLVSERLSLNRPMVNRRVDIIGQLVRSPLLKRKNGSSQRVKLLYVELDGKNYHSQDDRFRGDRLVDRISLVQGAATARYTYSDFQNSKETVYEELFGVMVRLILQDLKKTEIVPRIFSWTFRDPEEISSFHSVAIQELPLFKPAQAAGQ
jgi:prophage antirepressor-like protein